MSIPKPTKQALAYRDAYYRELEAIKNRWTPKGAGGEWSGQQISLARAMARAKASKAVGV